MIVQISRRLHGAKKYWGNMSRLFKTFHRQVWKTYVAILIPRYKLLFTDQSWWSIHLDSISTLAFWSLVRGVSWWLIFLFLHENVCCGYSLKASHRSTSNEYPQHMFSWWNKKNINIFGWKKASYLEQCCTKQRYFGNYKKCHRSLFE